MIRYRVLREWLKGLDESAFIYVDDDGLTLCAADEGEVKVRKLEVGELIYDEEDD